MDFAKIFLDQLTWSLTLELLLRSSIMYVMIILFLRLTGKRGVRQLSIFEVAIILSLGSIAGDPMFSTDLPLVMAFVVMSTIILLYRITTLLMMKYQPFEDLLEGKALYVVEEGVLVIEKIKQGKMSHDEFFSEMRQQNIEHLGQVKVGLLESDGKFSLLLYPPEQVRYGLPLFPKAYQTVNVIEEQVYYSCTHCGQTQYLAQAKDICSRCGCKDWAKSLNTQRCA